MAIVAVATPSTLPFADHPPIKVADTPSLGPAYNVRPNYLPVITGFKVAIAANIALAQGYGLNVNPAMVSQYFQGNEPGPSNDINTDDIHLNDVRSGDEIYAAFMAPLKY